ncbi:hypothetical protein SDC9_178852 [bioreactor metagenome]|uniref:Uncharacterized protein n=1 Tax=bioreactor metagenome TaxID=1076179 RepID=A0A645GXC7_9ZZZZ
MTTNKPEFRCPKCGAEIIAPMWGCGIDWDYGHCDHCGYDGELDTMTGTDPDGSVWQSKKRGQGR